MSDFVVLQQHPSMIAYIDALQKKNAIEAAVDALVSQLTAARAELATAHQHLHAWKVQYDELQADNARLRKDYEEGLEAWKVNSTWHAGWCERFMKELDKYRDAWEPDFSPVSQAMDEYKAARAGR